MRRSLVILALATSFVAACATLPEKLNKEIDAGNYRYAILQGEEYLAEKKQDEHLPGVLAALEKARFKLACTTDTPEAYKRFDTTYPSSQYKPEVMERWARVEFENFTRKTDTLAAYETFLKRFPEGRYAVRARERSAKLAWRQVDMKGTIDAYRGFRAHYPKSPCAAIALNKEIALAWAATEKANSVEVFHAFATTYAETEIGKTAMLMAHNLAWKRAKKEDSIDRYTWFRRLFPGGAKYAAAYARETQLAWALAEKEDTERTYRWYASGYPDTPEALTAEHRANDWAYFNSSRQGETPLAYVHQTNDRDIEKVWLYVDVRDRGNEFIAGLRPKQFTVYENGRSAPVIDFLGMESKRPIDIIFLVDVSGSMGDEIETVKASAIALASELKFRQRDVAFGLVTYCDDVHKVFGSNRTTKSARTFQKWMATIKTTSQGVENPVQAIWKATNYKFRKETQKVIVLVTDEPPNVTFDRKSRMNEYDAGKLMADGDFTFYAITPNNNSYNNMLKISGGKHFEIERYRGPLFAKLMGYIGALLSTQYRIAYSSPRKIGTGGNRKLRIRVDHQQTWLSRSEIEGQLIALFPDATKACSLVAVTREHGLLKSEDCGAKWYPIDGITLPGKAVLAAGAWGNNASLFVLLGSGKLVAVRNGKTVEVIGEETQDINSIAWSEAYPSRLWASGMGGIWLSEDAGVSFVQVGGLTSSESVAWVNVSRRTQQACYLTTDGLLWCRDKDDGGWRQLKIPGTSSLMPTGTQLFSCPLNGSLLFLRWGRSALYRSNDGGISWHPLPLPLVGNIGQVFIGTSGAKRVCFAAEKGLFCSTNRGLTWVELTDGTAGYADWSTALFGTDKTGRLFVVGADGRRIYQLYEVATREVVSGEVFFAKDADEPKKDLIPHLQAIGHKLAKDRTIRARVDGHTDSDGSDEYNLDLSKRRAQRVGAHLQAAGAAPWQLETAGHGESRPLAKNSSARNKAKNRRVEILLIREIAGN